MGTQQAENPMGERIAPSHYRLLPWFAGRNAHLALAAAFLPSVEERRSWCAPRELVMSFFFPFLCAWRSTEMRSLALMGRHPFSKAMKVQERGRRESECALSIKWGKSSQIKGKGVHSTRDTNKGLQHNNMTSLGLLK